jgi:branched-subunit amino acid transport protein
MVRRFIALIIGFAVLAAVLALICHLVFPDVLPYMPGEDDAFGWRREAAFLTTALAWLSAEVAVVLSVGLTAYLWKNRTSRIRSS